MVFRMAVEVLSIEVSSLVTLKTCVEGLLLAVHGSNSVGVQSRRALGLANKINARTLKSYVGEGGGGREGREGRRREGWRGEEGRRWGKEGRRRKGGGGEGERRKEEGGMEGGGKGGGGEEEEGGRREWEVKGGGESKWELFMVNMFGCSKVRQYIHAWLHVECL